MLLSQKFHARALICFFLLLGCCAWGQAGELRFQCSSTSNADVVFPVVEYFQNDRGEAVFAEEDYFWLSPVGAPQLPWHKWVVLLPPQADQDRITFDLVNATWETAGFCDVLPAPPPATWEGPHKKTKVVWPKDKVIEEGRDLLAYDVNSFWPAKPAKIEMIGRLADWKLAEVAIPLYRYNPVQQKLERLVDAEVTVGYAALKRNQLPTRLSRKSEDRVRKLVVNFSKMAPVYRAARMKANNDPRRINIPPSNKSNAPSGGNGYAIITTNAIKDSLTELDNFIAHKTTMGFDVYLVTDDEWGGGTGHTGSNNIRAWLQANYIDKDLSYVLLIGNPHTGNGTVPMKMCSGSQPTDYYYAELTAEWDKDGDGIYGEHGGGASQGSEADKYFELWAGRIPHYTSAATTDKILAKTIAYETSTDLDWRWNALFPMVPLDGTTPCWQLGEQLKEDYTEPFGIPSDRIYDEKYGILPPPEYVRSEMNGANLWAQKQFGVVIWSTHGSSTGASGIMSSSNANNLDDTRPAVTWQGSCLNSKPEASNNLGFALLKNGAIATSGATRVSWYMPGQNSYRNTNTVGGMAYQYGKRIFQHEATGEAHYNLKEALQFWLENFYVFVLYGDPSVKVLPPMPAMTVGPTDKFYTFRVEGGDFHSDDRIYTISNNSSQSLDYTVSVSETWLDVTTQAGTIPGTDVNDVEIRLSTQALDLPPGLHEATITFTDTTNGATVDRMVHVIVRARQLTGHWPVDEKAGTVAIDESNSEKNGNLYGNATFEDNTVPGRFDSALYLDGSDDCVKTPKPDVFSNSVTISAWIKPEGNQKNLTGIVMAKGTNSNAGLVIQGGNVLNMYWGKPGTLQAGLDLPVDEWSFVAMVVEPNKTSMYLSDADGNFLRQARLGESKMQFMGYDYYIGSNAGQSGKFFKGIVDDVRIYNYAKTWSEIQEIYAGGVANNLSPADGALDVDSRALRWCPPSGAISCDIYMGRSAYGVKKATKASREYKGSIAGNIHVDHKLLPNTKYFWRIDGETPHGTVKGKVWSFTTASAMVPFDIRTGLQTHLTMDDADINGETVYDTSGMPYFDGTMEGGAVPSQVGMIGEAIELDGVDDGVTVAQMDLNSDTVTVSIWIKPAELCNLNTGIVTCVGNGTNSGLLFKKNSQLGYMWDGSFSNWKMPLYIPVGEWSHVALAVQSDVATIYLNGAFVEHVANHNVEPFAQIIRLGANGTSSNRRMEGCIDDFFLWNRTLSQEDIMILYHGGLKNRTLR